MYDQDVYKMQNTKLWRCELSNKYRAK